MWNIRHLNIKNSFALGNPSKGIAWEEWFIKKYGAVRPKKELNTPFDFFWNNEKIDLKVCELYKRKIRRGKSVKKTNGWWTFNRHSNNTDFILCIGLINNKPIRFFKIPNNLFPKTGATISPMHSKYDCFIFNPISELGG